MMENTALHHDPEGIVWKEILLTIFTLTHTVIENFFKIKETLLSGTRIKRKRKFIKLTYDNIG
jgi:hypothetical protein